MVRMKVRMTRIQKLYVSNFLTGVVFWYGIEKLFMRSIGIDAIGVGVATAFLSVFNLMTDIPAGIWAGRVNSGHPALWLDF